MKKAPKRLFYFFCLILGCSSNELFKTYMDSGQVYYEYKKWERAARQFNMAVNEDPSSYEARIGLGNAAIEHGNDLLQQAHHMATSGNIKADEVAGQANDWHEVSRLQFLTALKMKPNEVEGWYGLGRLHYDRVSSPLRYPYGPAQDEESAKHVSKARAREIDQGIEAFEKVLEYVSNSYQSHRYLGLLLFLRMKEEKRDAQKAREHLLAYHDAVRKVHQSALHRPGGTEEQTAKVAELLSTLEQEMKEVQRVLGDYHRALSQEERTLTDRNAEDIHRLDWISKERLETESCLRRLEQGATALPPPK